MSWPIHAFRYVILNVNQASSDILVPVGMIEGDAQGDPVVTITPAQWESIVWPNGATGRSGIPGDGDWTRVRGTCTDVPGLPAAELLRGMHLRIGLCEPCSPPSLHRRSNTA